MKYHCIISQNCLKRHQIVSQRIIILKNLQGVSPWTTLGSLWPLATQDVSPSKR